MSHIDQWAKMYALIFSYGQSDCRADEWFLDKTWNYVPPGIKWTEEASSWSDRFTEDLYYKSLVLNFHDHIILGTTTILVFINKIVLLKPSHDVCCVHASF